MGGSDRRRRNGNSKSRLGSIEQRTSPRTAECVFLILEVLIALLTIGSCICFGVAIWVASLGLKDTTGNSKWFFDSEIYWNSAIFGLTLAAVLLVFAASEKHLAAKERAVNRT